MADKLRLGGMALANGVLVHGPTTWACAVRTPDGELKVVAERKKVTGSRVNSPFLRGPARLAESILFLPRLKRALPEARLPFQGAGALGAMAASAIVIEGLRRSKLSETAKELMSGLVATAPALMSVRGGELSAYHGAEHMAIGAYEQDAPHAKEHERCGSHLVGPLVLTTTAANLLAGRAREDVRPMARLGASLAAVAASTEIFGWMQRNPMKPLARALARPGYELQHRLSTAEPTAAQLEVAEAALQACLDLEAEVL